MILFVNDCNCRIWLPVFSLHNPHSAAFNSLYILEIICSLIVCGLVIKTIRAVYSSVVFHRNLNHILMWDIFIWFESLLFKFISLFYVSGFVPSGVAENHSQFWYSDDASLFPTIETLSNIQPLNIACILRWHYLYTITTLLFFLASERLCASFFILDYEKKRRSYIFYSLFAFSNAFTLPMTYVTFFNLASFCPLFSILVASNSIALVMFLFNRIFNKKVIKKFNNCTTTYSLAMRFQARENLKAAKLIQRIIIAGFVLLAFGFIIIAFIVFEWIPSLKSINVFFLEIVAHLNPLFLCPLVLLSMHKSDTAPLGSIQAKMSSQNEVDIYFKQLKNAWE
ncbi:unnamed protein product [Caenorhabditis bovis]|uniref:Serpentine Receptor, class E (Epsilon) n=1 Tax=Caenorhabditis bovis TaxID=2654633 RepID=A0A8S1FFK8_9PELO|nr:unnamed protein product [Caenorhabditis bovis]